MSTNNKVFQVLVPSGNQALAVAGTSVNALLPGQLGFFDVNTNNAVNPGGTTPITAFYIALGVGTGAKLSDIRTSAGQEIQTRNITAATSVAPGTATLGKASITSIQASWETDYTLKVEVTSLLGINMYGFSPWLQSYSVRTSCWDSCETECPSGSVAEVGVKLVKAVNGDKNAAVTAALYAEISEGTTELVDDLDAYLADPDNKNVPIKIELTAKAGIAFNDSLLDVQSFDIATVKAFLGSGFECTGTVENTPGTFAEGAGHVIREKEFEAGGYNGNYGIYRTAGEFYEQYPQAVLNAQNGVNYHQFNLTYDHHSKAGWGDYLNDLNTLIAVPVSDTVTITALTAAIGSLAALGGKVLQS